MVPLFSDPSILSYFQGKHSALDLVLPRLKKKKKKKKKDQKTFQPSACLWTA